MKSLYLIRHGRQNSTLCNVNVELSDAGKRQAELLGKRLKHYHIEKLYCSSLIRAKETAEIVGEEIGLKPEMMENLHEIDFGDMTDHTDEYVHETFKDYFEKVKCMDEDLPYPNGECGNDVVHRVMPVIMSILKEKEDHIVIVTHGGVIRALLSEILGLDQVKRQLFAVSLENCGITQLKYDESLKRFFLERFNDSSHLEGDDKLLRCFWK